MSRQPDLDLEALSAALNWRFEPARLSGEPVPMVITVGASFNLKK